MDPEASSINSLPTELLQLILQSLPIVDLMRCRSVCCSWRSLVDAFSEDTWHRFCARDHPEVHEKARTKCSPDLTWRQLYRSLHTWANLDSVDEYNWIELIRYRKRNIGHGVCGVNALNGQIMVKEDNNIQYYDCEGVKMDEFDTELQQIKYDETNDLIVYIGNNKNSIHRGVNESSELRIIKKVCGEWDLDEKIVIPKVQNFIIIGNNVYYDINKQKKDNNKETIIYECRCQENYSSKKLKTFGSDVVTYGYIKDRVTVLLKDNGIYVLENNVFVQKDCLTFSNTLKMARKYNLEPTEEFLLSISFGINLVIHSYCFYGNLTFLGCNDATVKVYDTEKFLEEPYLSFDSPLDEFDLYEWLRPVHKTWRNVTGVDVMEKKDGHFVIASIPKGAYAIELTHKCLEEVTVRTENEKEASGNESEEEVKRKKRKDY